MVRLNSMMVCVMVAVCGLAAGVRADDPKAGDPGLGGPAVRDRNVPGVQGSFGEGGEAKKRYQATRLPPNVFKDAMATIMGDDAPADVRVTDAQREKFEGWFEEFQDAARAYQKEHKQEIQDLRRAGASYNKPKRPGEAAPEGAAMTPDDEGATAARERMRQIMEGSPKVEDIYTKVWSELTEPQRKAVDGRIAEFRERQAQEREENYVRQKAGKKAAGAEQAREMERDRPGAPQGEPGRPARPPEGAPGRRPGNRPGDAPGAGANISPERRERLMRLLSRLTPEQQDQVIARLEERLREAGLDAGPGRGDRRNPEGRRGGPKPPPPMDDVNVPPPPPPADEMNHGPNP